MKAERKKRMLEVDGIRESRSAFVAESVQLILVIA